MSDQGRPRDSGKDISGRKDRRRKKERDNTPDLEGEEETRTYNEDVMNRDMASRDSGFCISGTGSALGARKKEIVKEKKKPTTRRKLVTENLSAEESLTNGFQNGDMASNDSGLFTSGIESALGAEKETVKEKKKPLGKLVPPLIDYWEYNASNNSWVGARKKETVELATENVSEENSITHEYQNGDLSARPGTSGVGGTPGDRAVNGMRDPLSWQSASSHSSVSGTQGDRIVNGMRDPSPRPSTNGVSTSTPRGTINDQKMSSQGSRLGKGARKKEKVEKKEEKKKPLAHRYDQNRDLSRGRGISGVGGTSGDRAVNGMSSMTTLSGHIKSIIKRECLSVMKEVLTTALEKVEALESKATKRTMEYEQISPSASETPKRKRELSPGSSVEAHILVTTVQRSGSAVGQYPSVPHPGTSGSHHPVDRVVSGVSTQWRQHRTTDDDSDSDNSGTKSPRSEKKSFFERQDLSNADEEQPEDVVSEDLCRNLLECSINGRSPRKTRKGSKSSELYEMSSVKVNLVSTRSYVGSHSDRRQNGHVASSQSRSQPPVPPPDVQRPIIRQSRLSLPATPPQTVYDAGARNCRCPRCGSVWTTELELEEHFFEHLLGTRSCAVGGCEYTCSSRNELRRHIRAAHLRKHTCRRCGKAYLMASTLGRHLRQCLPCRQCPLCPSACADDASLCDHVANAHGAGQIACNRVPELRYYVCRECRFATTSRTVALDHCQRHILGEINLNITLCEICDLLFVTGDLHFLMHAVDDTLNRKSFQVVDFDWRVSLNARRQLESSLKKIQATKAIKAPIDEETSTARSNVEETTIETNDIVAPQTETQLKIQEIYNDDSLQEKSNNIDLNQNESDVTDKLIETNLFQIGERVNKMQDLMQKYLAQRGTVTKNKSQNITQQEDVLEASTMKKPVQSETLIEQHTTVAMSQSNDNVDNNNQSLPSSSTAQVQNQNATLSKETPTAKTNFEESNVETNDLIAPPRKLPVESQVIINDNQAPVDSVEDNTLLQENKKQILLDHTKELNKPNSSKIGENLDKPTDFTNKNLAQCDTDSKTQLSNNTQQDDALEASKMKEPVQSDKLIESPLEQHTTVAMNQSNDNVDNNNQSLPSSSTAEVRNHNATLSKETPTAVTNFKKSNVETNDLIAPPSKIHVESQVIINDNEARVDSVEDNTLLQENKKQILLDQTKELNKSNSSKLGEHLEKHMDFMDNKLAQCDTDSKTQLSNNTQQDDALEASKMKEPVQSDTLIESPLAQHTTVAMNQSNDNVDNNNQSLPSSSTAEVRNHNATLSKETPTAKTNFEESNVETNDLIAPPRKLPVESQVIINDNQAPVDSVEDNTLLQENKKQILLDHTKELNKPNSSKIGENLDKPTDFTNKNLAQCGTDSNNQFSNTTQQDNVLEANTIKKPVQSEILFEKPSEQPATVEMGQSNDNVDNNKSLCSSLATEPQNQNAALGEETSTATNLKVVNVKTSDVIALSSKMQHEEEERIDSVEENTSLQQTYVNHTNKLNKLNFPKLEESIDTIKYSVEKIKELMQEADTMKGPVQSEILDRLNKFHVTEKLIETNLSQFQEKVNNMLDLMQQYVAQSGTVSKNQLPNTTQHQDVWEASTMKEPVQSETLFVKPLEQHTTVAMSQSNDNVDNNNQSLPSSSTAQVQNQNAASYEATSTAVTNFKKLNIETNDLIARPSKIHVESQVIINDNEARVDSVEDNTLLQENKKQILLDQTKELNKSNSSKLGENLEKHMDFMDNKLAQCDTDSKTQLPNNTQQDDALEASNMKEPVQSDTLIESPLEQHTTVAMNQSNDNVDNNNQSLPSSSTAEVQNQNAALYEVTSTAMTNNSSKLEENLDKPTNFMDNKLAQCVTDSKTQLSNTTQQDDVLEASKMKEPVQSNTLIESPLEQHTTVAMSQSNLNVDNSNQSLPSSSTAQVQNQNATLSKETPTAKTNFEESNVETNDLIAPPRKLPVESQVIINDNQAPVDSVEDNTLLQENKKQILLDHTKELNKPNSSKIGENLDKPTDFTNKNLAQCDTDSKTQLPNNTQQDDALEASNMKEPVQSDTLIESPLEQHTTVAMNQSNDNVDNNNQSLPSSSTAEVQNQNAALYEVTSTAMTNNSSKLEENLDKPTNFMDNKLAQCVTDSKTQLSNTTQQDDVLEASKMKEPVQSNTLIESPLEQHTTVAMSQSNLNVDNNNQSLPSSSTAQVQNQNATLSKETPTAKTNFEESNVETNDLIAPPRKLPVESQVIINDNQAPVDSVEDNTLLQENKKQILLDHTKELNKPNSSKIGENLDKPTDFTNKNLAQCDTDSKTQLSNNTQQDDALEASKMKEPVQSDKLIESPLEQHTTVAMNQSNDNVDNNNQSLPSSSTAEVRNHNATLSKETPTAVTNFKKSNVETNDLIAPPSKIHVESQVIINDNEARVDSVEDNTLLQENKKQILLDQTKELNKSNSSKLGEHLEKHMDFMDNKLAQCGTDSNIQLSNTTQQDNVLEANTIKKPVQSEILFEKPSEQPATVEMGQSNDNVDNNKQSLPSSSTAEVQNKNAALYEATSTAMTNNSSKLGENLDKPTDFTDNNLSQCGTDSNNQLSNTTHQDNDLEANTIKEPVQSEILVERPSEQPTTVEMNQSNDTVDNNNSLCSSLATEVQNRYVTLHKEAINSRSNLEDLHVVTSDIVALSSEMQLNSQMIDINEEASGYSEEQNTWLNLTKSRVNQSIELMQEINNILQQVRNTTQDPVQNKILTESSVSQQTTLKSSEFKDNMDKSQSSEIPFSSTAEVLNRNAALGEQTPTAGSNFEDSNVNTNFIMASSDEKHLESQVIPNDKEARRDSVEENTSLQENNDHTSLDYKSVNTNQTKEKKILITYSQLNEDNNDEASLDNNDSVKVALSSIDINVTISTTKKLSVTAEEANSQNVVLDKATQTSVKNAMSAGSPKEETITNDVVSDKAEDQISIEVIKTSAITTKETNPEKADQTGVEDAEEIKSLVATETIKNGQDQAITEEVLTEKPHVEPSTEKTMSSASANNETYIRANLGETQDNHAHAKDTAEATDPKQVLSEKPHALKAALEETQGHETHAEPIVISDSQTEATNANKQTSGEENKTVASPTEETNTKDVAIEKAEDLTSNAVETTEETNTEEVVVGNTHGRTNAKATEHLVVTAEATDPKQVLSEKPHSLKVALEEIQDHEAHAERTAISASQTEATNANEQTSDEENKTVASPTEKTNTKDVAIEKAEDLTSNATETTLETYTEEVVVGDTHVQTNAKETEHLVVTAEETDTKQVLTENSHEETTAKETTNSKGTINENNITETKVSDHTQAEESTSPGSPAEESNSKEISEKVQHQIDNEEKNNSSCTEKESQNHTDIHKTNSLAKTTKETNVKSHSQITLDLNIVENSKQYEKNVTDAKDETFSTTATTPSKNGQQANRGRGRGNNNKNKNNKNRRKGK